MTWNYRIVEYANGKGFGLHEVHYGDNGKEISMTEDPVRFAADSSREVVDALVLANMDATRRPVFVEPKHWSTSKEEADGEH